MNRNSFWGRNDIRGIVDERFGPDEFRRIGVAYARFVQTKPGVEKDAEPLTVAVGYDARLHSPALTDALLQGLLSGGLNVIHLGLSTSPIVYFSEHLHSLNPSFPKLVGTLVVTASHNPSEYNGVKFTFGQHPLSEEEMVELHGIYDELVLKEPLSQAITHTFVERRDIIADYQAWFLSHFGPIGRGLKVVVDSGNATAGIVAPELLRQLGCEVVELFSEPDGRFPNHHPDPCVHKNLEALRETVVERKADIGLAFDGDSDRLGLVDDQGDILPGDQLVLMYAEDLLQSRPNAEVIFDIKSTQTIFDFIEARGGVPILAPSGHAIIKKAMRERDIPLGGELSGHLFFRDRHWGFDDALYGGCRLVEILSKRRAHQPGYRVSDFRNTLPHTLISEEKRIPCNRAEAAALLEELESAVAATPDLFGPEVLEVLKTDGLRFCFPRGFLLVRGSNTEPCVTIRFEAENEASYAHMEAQLTRFCDQVFQRNRNLA